VDAPAGRSEVTTSTRRNRETGCRKATDDDRWPWLRRTAARTAEWCRARAVVTCSALRRSYRDLLSDGHPSVRFVYLQASEQELTERVTQRHHEYMPPALLRSQLDTLEPLADGEPGVRVETHGGPAAVADRALQALADAA
jgi:gluconokinase